MGRARVARPLAPARTRVARARAAWPARATPSYPVGIGGVVRPHGLMRGSSPPLCRRGRVLGWPHSRGREGPAPTAHRHMGDEGMGGPADCGTPLRPFTPGWYRRLGGRCPPVPLPDGGWPRPASSLARPVRAWVGAAGTARDEGSSNLTRRLQVATGRARSEAARLRIDAQAEPPSRSVILAALCVARTVARARELHLV